MAGYAQAAAAAAEGVSPGWSRNCSSNGPGEAEGGGVHPLLTVRTSSSFGDDAAATATVGCLCFLSPSVLAAGDTVGCVSLIDLDTRRPLAGFAAAVSCGSKRSSYRLENNVWGVHGKSSSRGGVGRLSWQDEQKLRSPLLHMAVIGGPSEQASSLSAAADAAALGSTATALRCSGEVGVAAEAAGQEAAPYTAAGGRLYGRQLLLQQKSSLLSLWDVEYLTPCCRFSTGSYSFCKFALLQDPRQQHCQQRPSHTPNDVEASQEQHRQEQGEDAVGGNTHDGLTDDPGPAISAGALLLAAPVADAESIGVFDLRCCKQRFATTGSSHSSSSLDNLAATVAQPALLLKPAAAVASACALAAFPAAAAPGGTGTAVSSLGVVHALVAAPGSTTPHPLLLAAYEFPCVALWDVRNNKQPLSTSLLPSPADAALSSAAIASSRRRVAATPAAPPSCLAVYRNQCWIGSFEGDLWVLKLKQRTRTFSAPLLTVNLVSSAFEANGTSSLTKRKNNKFCHTYSTSQQYHEGASSVDATLVRHGAGPSASSTACDPEAREVSDASAESAAPVAAALPFAADVSSSVVARDAGASTEHAVTSERPGASAALVQAPPSQRQLLLRPAAAAPAVSPPSAHACVLRLPHPDGDIGRQHALLCTAFRPDGAVVGVGTANGVLHLFETKSRECLGSLRQHGAEIKALAWCSQTGVLAATAAAGRIALWGLYLDSYSLT